MLGVFWIWPRLGCVQHVGCIQIVGCLQRLGEPGAGGLLK